MNKTWITLMALLVGAIVGCEGGPAGRPPASPADLDDTLPDCALEHRCGA